MGHTENRGFIHIRDSNKNIRMRIDPPDKLTKYDHIHIYDENGNPLDINLNMVDRKSPMLIYLIKSEAIDLNAKLIQKK